MILVDIEVLAQNKRYDFKLDENVYIADILEELWEILTLGKQSLKETDSLMLCSFEKRQILNNYQTLKQNGIGNGDCLILL